MSVTVALAGASGRIGRVIDSVLAGLPGFEVVARLGHASALSELDDAQLVVDVTRLDVSETIVSHAVEQGKKAVVGTSGWGADRIASLAELVAGHPGSGVLIVPNFSVGSVLATRLAAQAARIFPAADIVEAHHEKKRDAPSGTAVRTREMMDDAREDHNRPIPIHSVRLPGIIARQTVTLGGVGEYITISHETTSPDSYRTGIELAVGAAMDVTGVEVGLDGLLGLAE